MHAALELPRRPQNLGSTTRYRVQAHGHHPRLRHVSLEPAVVADFLHRVGHVDIQNLQYVPFMRYMLGEANAIGGESRFLHIDEWDERSRFLDHPLGRHPFHYKAPGSKNVDEDVERPVLFDSPFGSPFSNVPLASIVTQWVALVLTEE